MSGNARVLVVESSPELSRFIEQCLSQNYEVISACDGQEGLEKAMAHQPALIVSAIAMPKVTGADMIGRLRQQPNMKEIPVLLLAEQADEELKLRLLEDGAQDYLQKPFAERELQTRVRNLIDVRQSRQALKDTEATKRRAIDEFVATLAHELRNPLAPMRYAVKISKTPHVTEAQLKWAREVIERQVEHMARLLDDLLEVSRITRGKLELRKERVLLKESIAMAVETVRPLIEARGHEIEIDIPSGTVHIDADPVRLAQIVSNLLSNAAKYTDPGGVIRVQARVGEGNVVISVRDNGIGIPPERLPNIFEMFSQVTSAIDRSEGGLGIGLSLVRGLVLLHGGAIEAQSQGLGKGSEFIVTFPLAHTEPRPQVVSFSAAVATQPKRLRVLVADDNRDNANSCAMLLQMHGHDARTAYSGIEALELAPSFRPQFVLLDIGMPEMNGYEVARHMRAADWGKDIVLVAITGWNQVEDKLEAQTAGFDHHLAKPINFETLSRLFDRRR